MKEISYIHLRLELRFNASKEIIINTAVTYCIVKLWSIIITFVYFYLRGKLIELYILMHKFLRF